MKVFFQADGPLCGSYVEYPFSDTPDTIGTFRDNAWHIYEVFEGTDVMFYLGVDLFTPTPQRSVA